MKLAPAPNPHILLVDDNCDGLLVRRALLEEAGCTVELAHNGDEGLELFKIGKFDLVVTDFRMPGWMASSSSSTSARPIPAPE
jgi:CheY-like chemotaxis protein